MRYLFRILLEEGLPLVWVLVLASLAGQYEYEYRDGIPFESEFDSYHAKYGYEQYHDTRAQPPAPCAP